MQRLRKVFSMRTTRLAIMMVLTGTYFLIELITGHVTNSNALVADSFHMLSDLIALAVATGSIYIAKKSSQKNTFGWIRAETMGALINSVFLMALCFTIFIDALERIVNPEHMKDVDLLLWVGGVGLLVNLIGMALFSEHGHHHHHHHRAAQERSVSPDVLAPTSPSLMARYPERALNDIIVELQENAAVQDDQTKQQSSADSLEAATHRSRRNLNIKGVFLHVLADALGSVVVIISGCITKFVPLQQNGQMQDWIKYIDPLLSIFLVALIIASTAPLFKESALILLQTVPSHLNADRLKEQLLDSVPEINEIHDFHIWQLSNDKIIGSAHVKRKNLTNYMTVADSMKQFFHDHGIHSTTIQIEHDSSGESDNGDVNCLLSCPTTDGCAEQTCCGRIQRSNTDQNYQSNV